MAAKAGRLEAQMTIPFSEINFTDSVGLQTVTIPAADYYLADLVAEINTQLIRNWLVTVSDGEGTPSAATGLCTITTSDVNFTVGLAAAPYIRDALGFTGNIVGASSAQTGTRACPGLWLPGCPAKFTRHGDSDAGTLRTSSRQITGPTGTTYTIGTGTGYFRELVGILWDGVPGSRVRPHLATYTNETLEEFLGNTFYGVGTYSSLFSAGASNRIIWDADVDGTYKTGKFTWPESFDPDTMVHGWTGRYRIQAPRFIVGA